GLAVIQQIEDVGGIFISVADDLAADADQLPLDELLQDDPCVGFDIGRGNDGVGELGDIIGTPDQVELFFEFELFHYGENVDGHAFLRQGLEGPEDALMAVYIKTLGSYDLDDIVQGSFFKHDGPQNGLFQLAGLGRHFSVH